MIKIEALQSTDALETTVGIENTTVHIEEGCIEADVIHLF